MIEIRPHDRGSVLSVRAQPGARRDGVLGEHAGSLRIAVSVAPERGKANAAIVAVLAEALGCRKSRIAILSSETAREKRFLVEGMDEGEIRAKIGAIAASGTSGSKYS